MRFEVGRSRPCRDRLSKISTSKLGACCVNSVPRTARHGMKIAFIDDWVFRRSDMLVITRFDGSDLTRTLKVEGEAAGTMDR